MSDIGTGIDQDEDEDDRHAETAQKITVGFIIGIVVIVPVLAGLIVWIINR